MTLKNFLEIPASLLDGLLRSPGVHDAVFGSIFQEITVKLDNVAQNDFLFFAATHFLYEFFSFQTDDLGIRHRDLIGALLRSLARYEARLQLMHHPWTCEEPDLWSRNYLWEDPGRYRIGTWAVLLAAYDAQPAGANAFDVPHVVGVSRSHSQLVDVGVHREAHSVVNIVPDIVHMEGPRLTSNLSLLTSGRVSGRNSMGSSVSVDKKDSGSVP
ncbi:hypothetical protein HYPSUDRAFT_35548 [Hypholoma sublateritium FD-334 SS-4]|uniref:Uncharacterized protein n=1 Tax=Hypholoma sublateritium (strain FD-334 SS-4) TaxID=945553 RepID=A0A0D2MSP3_HYPSF|nr:hypothetical protein HYPSUDRAFT_35548 [Hypholoma sublateritium FD-334 SS-4]